MPDQFDRRIVAPELLALLQSCQDSVPFHLAGGAALAGVHLRHRLSRDADLFYHERDGHRLAVRLLPELAKNAGFSASIVRDAGTFVRAVVDLRTQCIELDLVFDAVPDVGPHPDTIEGVLVESLDDLRANKLTCILSRSEPRDLVDLLFLDRAGFPPEQDLALALRKDAGIDPGTLAWLLKQFPTEPLPIMLEPLDSQTLRAFRDALAERMRQASVPAT